MNSDQIIVYSIVSVISIFILAAILRTVFSISKFKKLQEAQLQILTEIAVQQGVKQEVINSIYINLGLYYRQKTNEEIRVELEKAREVQKM